MIGVIFMLIMLGDWLMQRKEQVKLKTRIIVLIISIGFWGLSEVLHRLKDQWNVPIFFRYLRESMFGNW